MDNAYRFGMIEVICEGYDYPDDKYILKGSCGVSLTPFLILLWLFQFSSFTIVCMGMWDIKRVLSKLKKKLGLFTQFKTSWTKEIIWVCFLYNYKDNIGLFLIKCTPEVMAIQGAYQLFHYLEYPAVAIETFLRCYIFHEEWHHIYVLI